MKQFIIYIIIVIIFVCTSHCAPLENKQELNKDPKSAFGPAFDEIVVESHLTVRRKNNSRQGRTEDVTTEAAPKIIKSKREINLPRNSRSQIIQRQNKPPLALSKSFGASAASAQAQAFNSYSPWNNFGALATGSQTQSFGFGPNGFTGAAGFSGTQQYHFNGQTVDIAFGNAFSGANGGKAGGAAITVTGPDGNRRPFSG